MPLRLDRLLPFLLLCGACTHAPSPVRFESAEAVWSALTPDERVQLLAGVGRSEVVLDALPLPGGGVLVGEALPAPEDATPRLRYRPRLLRDGRSVEFPFPTSTIADARFTAHGVLFVTDDSRLVLVEPDSGPRVLSHAVSAPLAVSADGRFAALTRGEMPEFEPIRCDLKLGTCGRLDQGLAPAWLPAFGPDGSIYFVRSAVGQPELWRAPPGQAARRLAALEPGAGPEGTEAPVVDGSSLRFAFAGRLVALGLDGRVLSTAPGIDRLRQLSGGQVALGATSPRLLPAADLARAP